MTDVTVDDDGRLELPAEIRAQYGNRYHIVQLHDGIELLPIADDPLEALRDEFADVEKSADELLADMRDAVERQAGNRS